MSQSQSCWSGLSAKEDVSQLHSPASSTTVYSDHACTVRTLRRREGQLQSGNVKALTVLSQ